MGAGQQINAIGLPRPVKTNAGPNAFLLEAEPMA